MAASVQRGVWCLAIGAVVAGCDGERPAPASSSAVPTATVGATGASSSPPLRVLLDGKPVEVQTVLASTSGGKAIRLRLSPRAVDCSDLSKRLGLAAPGDLDVVLAPMFLAKGKTGWGISHTHFNDGSRRGYLAPVTAITREPNQSVVARFALETTSGFGPADQQRITVDGELKARDCGVVQPEGRPQIQPFPNIELQVGGQHFRIGGATVTHRAGKYSLELSTAGRGCDLGAQDGDLDVTLHLQGRPVEATEVIIGGALFGVDVVAAQATRNDVRPLGTLDGNGTVVVEIDFESTVHGHAVTLRGKAPVKRCGPE